MDDQDPALALAKKTFLITMLGIALYAGTVFGFILFR
jgi:hypothetical protein